MAGLVEISNAPLASSSTAQIPPNVMFILDASGSMNSLFMPDDIDGKYDSKRVGSVSHRCNTLYYNPNVAYAAAKNANGTNFPNASFTAAENDPFSSDSPSGSTDLRNHQPWGDWGNQRGFYFVYTPGDAAWDALTAAQKDTACRTDGSGKNGWTNGNWKKVEVSAAEEQNFANWFTYYRTRLLLMKSSAGAAFNGLNDSFRLESAAAGDGAPAVATSSRGVCPARRARMAAWTGGRSYSGSAGTLFWRRASVRIWPPGTGGRAGHAIALEQGLDTKTAWQIHQARRGMTGAGVLVCRPLSVRNHLALGVLIVRGAGPGCHAQHRVGGA